MADRLLRFGGKEIDLRAPEFQDEPELPDSQMGAYVVQFTDRYSADEVALLRAYEVQEIAPLLSEFALPVRISGEVARELREVEGVEAVVRFKPAWKLQAYGDLDPELPLCVYTFAGHEHEVANLARSQMSAVEVVFEPSQGVLYIQGSNLDRMAELLRSESVLLVAQTLPARFDSFRAAGVVGAKERKRPFGGEPGPLLGLTGRDQAIAVYDSGMDTGDKQTLHTAFEPTRVTFSTSHDGTFKDTDGHGTHVAGIIASRRSGRTGIAPDVEVLVQKGEWPGANTVPFFDQNLQEALRGGALVHNDSWGVSHVVNGKQLAEYMDFSAAADHFMWNNPTFTIVTTAGNNGLGGPGTINSPGTAKNVITVGSTESEMDDSDYLPKPLVCATLPLRPDRRSKFSGQGPTADNRIKPDLLAPGEGILAPMSKLINPNKGMDYGVAGDLCYSSGTSMAAPVVSGCLALLGQWLATTANPRAENPTSALLKALLINGAESLAHNGGWGSPTQGWGRINLTKIIRPDKGIKLWWTDESFEVAEQHEVEYTFKLSGKGPLKVTLVWRDQAANTGLNHTLQNDLHLRVFDPNGRRYLGNKFDRSLQSLSSKEFDRSIPLAQDDTQFDTDNNVECVNIDPKLTGRPLPKGEWRVQVIGAHILHQPGIRFALVASGPNLTCKGGRLAGLGAPSWITPAGRVGLNGGDTVTLSVQSGINLVNEPWWAEFTLHRLGQPEVFAGNSPPTQQPSQALSVTWTIPTTLPSGSYQLRARIRTASRSSVNACRVIRIL